MRRRSVLVIYRMCGIPSTNPSPVHQDNKFELNKLCLKSFVEGFKDINPTVHFILDHCDFRHNLMIQEVCPFDFVTDMTEVGINNTMLLSYRWATQSKDEYVYFAECDYVYRPNIGKTFLEALKTLKLVSPYDHKNFYLDKTIHSENCKMRLVNDTHFRTTERNTMTFGCSVELVKENLEYFNREGYLDNEIWHELAIRGNPLWVPILSMATHMAKDWLAPSVNWEQLWTSL